MPALREVQTWRPDPRPSCWAPAREWAPSARTIPVTVTCPRAPFTEKTTLFTKLILTYWGLDLVTKSLCVHLTYLFTLTYCVFLFIFWDGCLELRPMLKGWPLLPIRGCLRVRSLPAEVQGRAPHQLRNNSTGPLLDSRTPPQNWGRDDLHSKGVYEAIKYFFVWKMPN